MATQAHPFGKNTPSTACAGRSRLLHSAGIPLARLRSCPNPFNLPTVVDAARLARRRGAEPCRNRLHPVSATLFSGGHDSSFHHPPFRHGRAPSMPSPTPLPGCSSGPSHPPALAEDAPEAPPPLPPAPPRGRPPAGGGG